MAKVFIADSCPVFTAGLRYVLEQEGHLVVTLPGSRAGLFAEIDAISPDAVFLEPPLSDDELRQFAAHLREHCPKARILMVADFGSDHDITRLNDMGISCIVGVREEPETYTRCLITVLEGNGCCVPDSTKFLQKSNITNLSRREWEIVQLVIEGKRNQQIADFFCIKVGTVKVHLSRIFKKLNVNSRVELILALQKNIR